MNINQVIATLLGESKSGSEDNMENVTTRYIFDLTKINNFIFEPNTSSSNVNSEIIETYEQDEITNEFNLNNKVMREVKDNDFSNQQTIRYDLLKIFIQTLMNVSTDGDDMSLGESVIINTLLHEGIIKEVKIKE